MTEAPPSLLPMLKGYGNGFPTSNFSSNFFAIDLLTIVIDPSQTILPYCEGVKTAQLGAIANGGTLGYTYLWDDNAILPQTSSVATGLLADNYNSLDSSYTVTVTDSKGCIASVSTDVLRYFTETMHVFADSLYLSQYVSNTLDSNEVSCFGYNDGSLTANVNGGTPDINGNYLFEWSTDFSEYSSVNSSIFDLFHYLSLF